jgi:hypothetical protein
MICKREKTVSALWDRIKQYHVVHVRATPASGKSTLSRLLQHHVEEEDAELPVLWGSWPVELLKTSRYDIALECVFNIPPDKNINWLHRRALLIIDEAQLSYTCVSFWNDFIKALIPTAPPMVVLFSSWGSAARRAEALTQTPVMLKSEQRISIRPSKVSDISVFFTYAEFLDVIERVKANKSQFGQAFSLDEDVIDYIWIITNGHPAAVILILEELATSEVSISTDTDAILKLTFILDTDNTPSAYAMFYYYV